MKKVFSPLIKKHYWIGLEPSPDGLPVFSLAEADLLKNFRDTLTKELLETVYETKRSLPGTPLEQIATLLLEKKSATPHAMQLAVDIYPEEDPQESLGYRKKPVNPGLKICAAVIETLKHGGAKPRELIPALPELPESPPDATSPLETTPPPSDSL